MANIIFNSFFKDIISNGIDLTKKNTYKACLLKESFYDIASSTGDINNFDNYSSISLAGFECKDTGKYNGYVLGGEYITLEKFDLYKSDSTTQYFFNNRLCWYNVTLVGENAPRYVLLYRESDGYALACFDLNVTTEINEDNLIIDWGNNPVININTSDLESTADSNYSLTSDNSLQNKVITQGLLEFGVAIGKENVNLPESEGLQIDTLNRIEDDSIVDMFNSED